MFTEETVFILGAGASWHYGYPTGEELVEEMLDEAGRINSFWSKRIDLDQVASNFIKELGSGIVFDGKQELLRLSDEIRRRIQSVKPLVIDYFLGQNPEIEGIGKLLIGTVLLDREWSYIKLNGNVNRRKLLEKSVDRAEIRRAKDVVCKNYKDDWLRFVIEKLVYGCGKPEDLLKNKVSFVTFNYDVSLENRLYKALSAIEFFPSSVVEEFLYREDLVIHMYGKIRSDPYEDLLFGKFPQINDTKGNQVSRMNKRLDAAWEAAQSLLVMAPKASSIDADIQELVIKKTETSKKIFILGYGFDSNNNKYLGLENAAAWVVDPEERKTINFTIIRQFLRAQMLANLDAAGLERPLSMTTATSLRQGL